VDKLRRLARRENDDGTAI